MPPALTNSDGDAPTCVDQSPLLILSRISRSRVAESGMRSSASARHMSAMPSRLSSENSSINASTPPAFERSTRTACGQRRGQRLRRRQLVRQRGAPPRISAATPVFSSLRHAAAMRSGAAARGHRSAGRRGKGEIESADMAGSVRGPHGAANATMRANRGAESRTGHRPRRSTCLVVAMLRLAPHLLPFAAALILSAAALAMSAPRKRSR